VKDHLLLKLGLIYIPVSNFIRYFKSNLEILVELLKKQMQGRCNIEKNCKRHTLSF